MTIKNWIKFMEYGNKIGCHQMPSRSFFIKGYQMPLCARCVGVFISYIIAIPIFFKKKTPLPVCFFMGFIMFMDWYIQYLKIKESTNIRRLITGIIGGFGVTTIHLYLYKKIFNIIYNIKKR